jgi:transposase InsO family protein
MAVAFVHTLRRSYLDGAVLDTGESVMRQLQEWIEDYSTVAPHSSLGYRPPVQYRQKERSI